MVADTGAAAASAGPGRPGRDPDANTPWGLLSTAGKGHKDLQVSQGSLSAIMEDNKRHWLNKQFEGKPHEDFGRKAWTHSDRNNSAWIIACPKEHIALNAKQFPVVA